MTNKQRCESLEAGATARLLAMEQMGLIKILPGQGKGAITFLTTVMANQQEEGIDQAASLFSSSDDSDVLNEAAKTAILKLKE